MKFVSVMTDFVAVASYNFSEIEEAYIEMISKVYFLHLETHYILAEYIEGIPI